MARITRPRELAPWRALCFYLGLASLWLALASPLDALDEFLLVAHMTQHLLLMSIAPPLLLLGNPVVPLLRGLPKGFVREELAPWINSRAVHWLQRVVTSPVFGWLSMALAVVMWHIPAAYELALRSNSWHQVEHGCFFFASLAFWWYVVRPWPGRFRSSRWMIVPYLASAHMIVFFVGLIIALDGHVLYPTYAHVPRLFGLSAMTDQALAGGEMIIVGLTVMIASLVPLLLVLVSDEKQRPPQFAPEPSPPYVARPMVRDFDLLHLPLAGAFLRSRYGRRGLQALSLALIAAVICDGLFGVQIAQLNMAGVLVWNIVRPVNLLLLLLVANVFCMACPFTLPRELVRLFRIPQLRWPEWLSSKWLAAALMLLFFWSYEQFSLWRSPRDTALLLISYVAGATIVNSVFHGASFCKYVCPVGQFNFIASMFAPLELGVRNRHVCSACSTHDCVRGNDTQRGCELKLYLPNKAGNFDCTLCMDCVRACPHDNVSILPQFPLRDISRDPARSSLGRFSARPDLAVLVLVVVFSSIANAAVMIAPVARVLGGFQQRHPWAANSLLSLLATCIFSVALLVLYTAAARVMQALSRSLSLRVIFCRFSLALLPLGLSIWLGHLMFHLASSWPSVPILLHRMSAGLVVGHHAVSLVARPMRARASSSMLNPIPGVHGLSLFDLQVWIVNLGLFVTWFAGRTLIRQISGPSGGFRSMLAVWICSSTGLYAIAVWIFTQPMYMRGMAM